LIGATNSLYRSRNLTPSSVVKYLPFSDSRNPVSVSLLRYLFTTLKFRFAL